MAGPKLYYYAGKRGEAEAIRLLFHELQLDYEDVSVSEKDVAAMTAQGDLLFGTVPMLEWDGIKLVEQAAIMEHIAVKSKTAANYLGRNENERSVARSLANAAEDLRREVMQFTITKSGDLQKAFEADSLKKWFINLDGLAKASIDDDAGLGPGTDFTFGDAAMFDVVNYITEFTRSSILRPYPNLKEWHDKCFARPNIHAYMKARPAADW